MDKKYNNILTKAIPYYRKGRPGDIEHIRWLFRTVPKYVSPLEVDYDILIPLVLLHDVGYAKVPKDSNSYNLDIRKFHSEQGAIIAQDILTRLKYPKEKAQELKRLILKHDNWAFGDDFSTEPLLRIFNNFDFMWMASRKGFAIARKMMKKSPSGFYRQMEEFQRKNISDGRKWFSRKVEKLYHDLMRARRDRLSQQGSGNQIVP